MDFSNYSRTVPKVSFSSKELELYMYNFMKDNMVDANGVNGYIGLVMLRLGFKTEDKILLSNFSNDNKEGYFQCIVNDDMNYLIKFENVMNKKMHTRISLLYFNKLITYECFPLRLSEIGVRIIPVLESIKYDDGVCYTREYSRDNAKYIVEYLDYRIELDVVRPRDVELAMYDEFGKYSRYRIDNEDLIVDYFSDFYRLWNDKNIVKVYKTICELSLGNNTRKYGDVVLSCFKNDDMTDLIELKNGELERFGITLSEMGRTLFLNRDGNFSVICKNDLFSYVMNFYDNKINYNVDIDNSIDDDLVSKMIKNDKIDIKNEVGNVKKLVRKLFNNNGDSE